MNSKRYTIKLLSLLLVLLSVAAASPALASSGDEEETGESTTEFETYTNIDYGFSMEYPPNWEVQESSLQEYQIVKFLSAENVPAAISVFMGEINPNMTLQQAANFSEGIDIRVIDMTNTTMGTMPAIEQVFYQYEFGTTAKVKKVSTLSNQDLINIRYITEPQNFEEYLQEFDYMLQSFKVS